MQTGPHLPLNPRDLLVLTALLNGPLHGYGIIKTVEERSDAGVVLDPANLYRVLRRMRSVGLIDEVDSTESSADDRRKTYALTEAGRAVVAAELRRLERLLGDALPALAEGGLG